MTFNELVLTTESITNDFDTLFNQCVAFAEASYQEYKTNLKEAELKVIQESGTTEDLIYLESQAKEGFIVRTGKTIKKLVESFIAWLKQLVSSIKDFIENKTNKEALDRAEKVVKNNPKLRNEKIEIDDVDKIQKICGKHEAKIKRKIALFKAKKFSSKDAEELDNIQKEFENEMSTAKKVTIGVSIAAAIAMVAKLSGCLSKQEKDMSDMDVITIDENSSPEDVEAVFSGYSIAVNVGKEKAKTVSSVIKQIFTGIKAKITGTGQIDVEIGKARKNSDDKEEKKGKNINESTYLDELISEIEASAIPIVANESTEDVATESSDADEFNAEAYLESLEQEVISESEEDVNDQFSPQEYLEALEAEIATDDKNVAEEDTEDSETTDVEESVQEVTAEEYLEAMEAELFNEDDDNVVEEGVTAEEYLEAMEAELFV